MFPVARANAPSTPSRCRLVSLVSAPIRTLPYPVIPEPMSGALLDENIMAKPIREYRSIALSHTRDDVSTIRYAIKGHHIANGFGFQRFRLSMPTVLRKQWFCLTQTVLGAKGGGSHLVFVIGDDTAERSDTHRRIAPSFTKGQQSSLIIPAPAFCHPIEAFTTITDPMG